MSKIEIIEILLPTFNGSSYLEVQLESIFEQTNQDWKLLIRDDGSTDETVSIIEKWQFNYPEKINIILDGQNRLGASGSFSKLMEYSSASYVMLCDQDDFWLPLKVEKSLNRLLKAETEFGKQTPIMICSDLEVVDEHLNPISRSFWKDRKDDPSILDDFEKLIAHSVVTGNTIMLNRAGINVSAPIKTNFFLHDQWISINVARYGKVIFINEPLLKYRQHTSNVLGSFKLNKRYLIKKVKSIPYYIRSWNKLKKELEMDFSLRKVVFFKLNYNWNKIFND
ncbi:glycosyltransferase family 2 protein [Algoriphagus antarcticus]|uniref:Glycosyltransferase involved in cell wall biosynthesis n=1 Tax=Algoriphagus antarcticus TaxID=238540 RepID=A0A3E0DZU7_9BACT|nr:glycosyltransferase family 2 protein [Algoriphagus antarcticus]REG91491.1 glycosyltransferase involved in cell wall biosynthesis [Algoriphagus antarcticus]